LSVLLCSYWRVWCVYLASGSEFAKGRQERAVNLIQCCPLLQHPALIFSLPLLPGFPPPPVNSSLELPGVNTKRHEFGLAAVTAVWYRVAW
jgi:hypothetical protein